MWKIILIFILVFNIFVMLFNYGAHHNQNKDEDGK